MNGKTLEYLARIAARHKIGSSEFFNCIVEAWKREESKCKQLIIRCRRKTKDSAIFLFTVTGKVVAQFPISTKILQRSNQYELQERKALLEGYMRIFSAKSSSLENFDVLNPKIEDLKAGMKKVNLEARVLKVPNPNMVYTRSGTMAPVSNALIGDETGTIRIALWNQQIKMVSNGDVIEIENAKVASFRGELQLRIGRSGSLSVIK